jgi:acyl-CoA thioester hydrolase
LHNVKNILPFSLPKFQDKNQIQKRMEHKTPVQIRFNDIDLMGHVYNAKYQEFFDLARISYFNEVLGGLISWTEMGLVIASIKIDYARPVYLEDRLTVVSGVVSLGEKSLEMFQQVFKNGATEPVASGRTILVCFDMRQKESKILPGEWRKRITDVEPGLQVG